MPPNLNLSVLAPTHQAGEALSSWLARAAQAHCVTIGELEEEVGVRFSAADRGDPSTIAILARVMCAPVECLQAMVSPDLISHPMRPGQGTVANWSVCEECLLADRSSGRPLHLREWWVHPLATSCLTHSRPLTTYGTSDCAVVDAEVAYGERAAPAVRDHLLERATLKPLGIEARVRRLARMRGAPDAAVKLLQLRFAVRDIVDALGTQARDGRSLMQSFEGPLFGRPSLPGALRLLENWWADQDAVTRRLYVHVALLILEEPPDPCARASAIGQHWLRDRYQHSRIAGWAQLFEHAAADLLFILTTELRRETILQLSERSRHWPPDLRKRWTYAVAVGATGGFVF
jgi:hypothetical protein